MENSFASLIESANSILVLLPTKPYFDQVAAALALYLSLSNSKIKIGSIPINVANKGIGIIIIKDTRMIHTFYLICI